MSVPTPERPTYKTSEFDQNELLPVTSTELFEDVLLFPMYPGVFCNLPLLLRTRVLLNAEEPTALPKDDQIPLFDFTPGQDVPDITQSSVHPCYQATGTGVSR